MSTAVETPTCPTWIDCADVAKLVRKALREKFPGAKFSVRSSRYAGGASVDVSWTGGPTRADVDAVAKQFAGATFDGMTDSMNYHPAMLDGRPVRFGADFVCTSRRDS